MSGSDIFIIYLYSYLPALLFGLCFWWMDRFEREPLYLVFLAFLWGSFGAGSLSYFLNTFFHIAIEIHSNFGDKNSLLTAVVVAPLVEEFTKGILILAFLFFGKIDNITDGILFGILIGLGFAAGENVHYAENTFSSYGEIAMWNNLWFRELHTTLLHASSTAVWGAMIAYARFLKKLPSYFTIFNGFILSVVTHGFWNFMAHFRGSMNSQDKLVDWIMRGELFVIFLFLLTIFLFSLKKESDIIIRELLDEHKRGIIPKNHIEFFASLVRHSKRFQLPKDIAVYNYAHTGIKLAFKKNEYRYRPTRKLDKEIKLYRQNLKAMSGYTPESLTLSYVGKV